MLRQQTPARPLGWPLGRSGGYSCRCYGSCNPAHLLGWPALGAETIAALIRGPKGLGLAMSDACSFAVPPDVTAWGAGQPAMSLSLLWPVTSPAEHMLELKQAAGALRAYLMCPSHGAAVVNLLCMLWEPGTWQLEHSLNSAMTSPRQSWSCHGLVAVRTYSQLGFASAAYAMILKALAASPSCLSLSAAPVKLAHHHSWYILHCSQTYSQTTACLQQMHRCTECIFLPSEPEPKTQHASLMSKRANFSAI